MRLKLFYVTLFLFGGSLQAQDFSAATKNTLNHIQAFFTEKAPTAENKPVNEPKTEATEIPPLPSEDEPEFMAPIASEGHFWNLQQTDI